MAHDEEQSGNIKRQFAKLFEVSLKAVLPDEQDLLEPMIEASTGKNKVADYQCNNALPMWSKLKDKKPEKKKSKKKDKKSKVKDGTKDPVDEPELENPFGQAIAKHLPISGIIKSCSVLKHGFVMVELSNTWMAKHKKHVTRWYRKKWAPQLAIKRAVVDFSSPNIAKEMHVGHLRSTIIGDTLSRMLEFSNVEVLRRNHVGDWGTQFGMLIEFLFENFPNSEDVSETAIGDLQEFYKASKQRFETDAVFKERAQRAVVLLQSGQPEYRKAWAHICEISRKEFDRVYQRLGVQLEEKGDSFYNPYIPGVLKELSDQGLIEEDQGARVIFLEGFNIPLIVVKSDGGYNYASTDLTALWISDSGPFRVKITVHNHYMTKRSGNRYRLNEEKAEWIINVTDVGQKLHFDMFFKAAKRAGWLPADGNLYPKVSHVDFGLVLGEDGKRFRTRNTKVVRLVDLLDEAKSCSKAALIERGKAEEWTGEELEKTAEAVGYGAVKYADLKTNRLTNYTFDFDQMLSDKGNTAVYLLYAHARTCSIIRKSDKNIEELKKTGVTVLDHAGERELGLDLLQFAEMVEEACANLLPNILCEYLYNLSQIFTKKVYSNCKVVGSPEETSRLLLCEATATVMRKCFHLLGIVPIYKI
ncbi:hypothetical protein FEM48_Zijuj12G0144200 [Ziziphus jujuba var. spinosa]|uniref:arginine--tRNA ligase n=1 Tax=Ziziphus jujuba var. spinosa TaxID=714518 RepID=A0A978UDV1_ZIZJJ|nr:hypothetical protein FEM48_Zijuj12G0144200 [Ziziphus jujuba var. spinosa]